MGWTSDQLKSHPKREQLIGARPHQKASDAVIAKIYKETNSVRKTGESLGMCGQSVWERLRKMGITNPPERLGADVEKLIISFYSKPFKKGELKAFCAEHKLPITSVARWARGVSLTDAHRGMSESDKQAVGGRTLKMIAENGHPKGMLGKKHTEESLAKISEASTHSHAKRSPAAKRATAQKMLKTKVEKGTLITPRKGSWKQAWHDIGGKHIFLRSSWETRYANYLQLLKLAGDISEWEYEPKTFWFDRIRKGTTNYTPDFRVTFPGGRFEYHEVKGWMDDRSKTKLKRMRIYHPDTKVVLIDAAWFKAHKALAKTVPGWV